MNEDCGYSIDQNRENGSAERFAGYGMGCGILPGDQEKGEIKFASRG